MEFTCSNQFVIDFLSSIVHSWTLNATDGNPVRESTGKIVAGSEERHRGTIPTPRFARRPPKIAYMIYNYIPVTGAHDTVLDYADLFTITLRNDDVQEFDTRWVEILFL